MGVATQYITLFDIHDWEREGTLFLVEKLMCLGLFPKRGTVFCPKKHAFPMVLRRSEQHFRWRCTANGAPKKSKKKICNYGVSINTGTVFAKSKLGYGDICKLIIFWLKNTPLTVIREQLRINSHQTIVEWASFCRDVTYEDLVNNNKPIGGVGRTVEIDESTFGSRKYHRGKNVEDQWVFGGFDRENGDTFMVPVKNGNEDTIIAVIETYVLPGTTVITDYWKKFKSKNLEKYNRLKEERSIDIQTLFNSAHSNSVRGSLAHENLRQPSDGWRKDFMPGYLAKYMFLRRCKIQALDAFVEFCRIAGKMFDPTNPNPYTNSVEVSEEQTPRCDME